jgi:hypothetical protein
MNTTLKIIGTSPIYANLEGEFWEVFIRSSSFHENIFDILVKNGPVYLFELKKLRPYNNKWLMEGFLSNEETMGRITFEQQ